MSARQKDWARRARANLLATLSAVCANCGRTDDLTFDCIRPTGHKHHTFDTSARMSFYRRQHAEGNLQVLCKNCNGNKDRPRIGRPAQSDRWRYTTRRQ